MWSVSEPKQASGVTQQYDREISQDEGILMSPSPPLTLSQPPSHGLVSPPSQDDSKYEFNTITPDLISPPILVSTDSGFTSLDTKGHDLDMSHLDIHHVPTTEVTPQSPPYTAQDPFDPQHDSQNKPTTSSSQVSADALNADLLKHLEGSAAMETDTVELEAQDSPMQVDPEVKIPAIITDHPEEDKPTPPVEIFPAPPPDQVVPGDHSQAPARDQTVPEEPMDCKSLEDMGVFAAPPPVAPAKEVVRSSDDAVSDLGVLEASPAVPQEAQSPPANMATSDIMTTSMIGDLSMLENSSGPQGPIDYSAPANDPMNLLDLDPVPANQPHAEVDLIGGSMQTNSMTDSVHFDSSAGFGSHTDDTLVSMDMTPPANAAALDGRVVSMEMSNGDLANGPDLQSHGPMLDLTKMSSNGTKDEIEEEERDPSRLFQKVGPPKEEPVETKATENRPQSAPKARETVALKKEDERPSTAPSKIPSPKKDKLGASKKVPAPKIGEAKSPTKSIATKTATMTKTTSATRASKIPGERKVDDDKKSTKVSPRELTKRLEAARTASPRRGIPRKGDCFHPVLCSPPLWTAGTNTTV